MPVRPGDTRDGQRIDRLMRRRRQILLLSGYDAASHRYWRELLVRGLPQYDWRVVALPDRHFYWRVRGNPLGFAYPHRQALEAPADLIIATSMVDLATLRGFVPSLAKLPTLLYFHENQFAYPTRKPSSNIVNAQITSIYSALCATRIVFNSHYNQSSFFTGAQALLAKMPDGVPAGLLDPLKLNSDVLPVPLEASCSEPTVRSVTGPKQIVWNHRWEYDKQPQVFFDAMQRLNAAGHDFRLHVMGQSFRTIPECFEQARQALSQQILTWGYQPQQHYRKILASADIVVSTALHDFQGLSTLEAIHRGCLPVVPDRVAYPEYVPAALRYRAGNPELETTALADRLAALVNVSQPLPAAPDVSAYMANKLVPDYQRLIDKLCAV